MRNLLIEIGTEDLPASKCKDILDQTKSNLPSILKNYRLSFKSIDYFLTHRRISAKVQGLSEYQIQEKVEKRGPPVSIAFDNSGNPTKELIGFLKNNNASLEQIEIRKIKEKEREKEYVFILTEKESKNIREIIKDILLEFIKSFHFEKPMYWISKDFSFIRPIRWITILLDNEVIEEEYYKNEDRVYKTGGYTYGNRVFYPKKIKLKSVEDYVEALRGAMVIPDPKVRENLIRDSISKIELETGLKANLTEDLLEKLVFMYEYPCPVISEFDTDYLILPEELITTIIVNQQSFIPLIQGESLSNKFIVFKEGEVIDPEVNKYNYRKVIEARLEDALHLLKEDRKILLASRIPKLNEIVYYDELGTLYDKTIRVKAIAEYICNFLNVDEKIVDFVLKAATLSKADRTTKIVFEYPNLQGIIGKYLALEQGESEAVATAIFEHYLPQTPEDKNFPSRYESIILSLADRIDTIVSFISIGNTVKSKDTIGLRRALSTLINLIHNFKLSLDLEELIKYSYFVLEDKKYGMEIKPKTSLNRVIKEIKEFFFNRVEEIYKQEGKNYDKIRAVLHLFFKDYNLANQILNFIDKKPQEEIKNIVFLSKRLKNIVFNDFLKKEEFDENLFPYLFEDYDNIEIIDFPTNLDIIKIKDELLTEKAEVDLHEFILQNQDTFFMKVKESLEESFQKIEEISFLAEEFFKNVFVMDENPNIRLNRILLIYKTFLLTVYFADFSKISL